MSGHDQFPDPHEPESRSDDQIPAQHDQPRAAAQCQLVRRQFSQGWHAPRATLKSRNSILASGRSHSPMLDELHCQCSCERQHTPTDQYADDQSFGSARRDAEILRSGGSLVSTLYAADEKWFADRQIKAYNVASNANPLLSPQGLGELARMLADGTITERIGPRFEQDEARSMLE
jgi:hypothetical protein